MGAILSLLSSRQNCPVDTEECGGSGIYDSNSSRFCVFCNVTRENGFDVERENPEFIVFKDRDPAAAQHFLVIPKVHIANVKSLKKTDVAMVERMADFAMLVLDHYGVPPTSCRLGFHIPPFNSVQHLHLHAHGLPYKSFIRRLKYIISPGFRHYDKGFSWFVDVTQAMRILERGQRIGVFPC